MIDSNMPTPDRFVMGEWVCTKCRKSGTVNVWARRGEVTFDALKRHRGETQRSCVEGCLYIVAIAKAESC